MAHARKSSLRASLPSPRTLTRTPDPPLVAFSPVLGHIPAQSARSRKRNLPCSGLSADRAWQCSEAIDKTAVDNPSSPTVDPAITAEVADAQKEVENESKALEAVFSAVCRRASNLSGAVTTGVSLVILGGKFTLLPAHAQAFRAELERVVTHPDFTAVRIPPSGRRCLFSDAGESAGS
eukprot:754142-Hanusia_phi.AAC.2